MKKIVNIIILLAVAGLIFFFSAQTYEQQSLIPLLQKLLPGEPLAGFLSQIEVSYWKKGISVDTVGYYYFLEFLIRKFAHLSLFGFLAIALFSVLMYFKKMTVWRAVCLSLLGAGLYAASDELHQYFTGDRTALIDDVFLDITGAGIALILYVPLYAWKYRKKR